MEKYLSFFKVISDKTRLEIMMLLYKGEHCVCELEEILKIKQPNISKNLIMMKNLDFLSSRRDKNYIYYIINLKDPKLEKIFSTIIKNIEKDEGSLNN